MARHHMSFVAAEDALIRLGYTPAALTLEQTHALRDAWRRVYARPLKRSHGVWHRGAYDWHIFSFEDTYALEGDDARRAYAAERCAELVFLPNDKHDRGCRVVTVRPPELGLQSDVYVFPPDLSWTVVFTHEDGWMGPYFSRASWVDAPPASTVGARAGGADRRGRRRR